MGSGSHNRFSERIAGALNFCAISSAALSVLVDKENLLGNVMLIYNFVLSGLLDELISLG